MSEILRIDARQLHCGCFITHPKPPQKWILINSLQKSGWVARSSNSSLAFGDSPIILPENHF
ncbi:MAG: hypothetical protein IPI60_13720 [Saprospiraceae bacterium]|nr:hypothetical protein [Saprospiraceae bacterium]